MVLHNTLELLVGLKALPLSSTVSHSNSIYVHRTKLINKYIFLQQFTLGLTSLSRLGPVGAALQVIILLYLYAASCTGLYGGAMARRLRPRFSKTPLSHLIANCALFLVFSSALPLLAKILGLYRF